MNWIIGDMLMGLAVLVLPIALFALVIHGLEHFMQSRLARRFGWRSVLWTAWLGTPIHEFSHVVMCWIFRHRIEEVRLFDPDVNAGRLGFVRHSFHRGNWFEEFGNVWIGTAPLLGAVAAYQKLKVENIKVFFVACSGSVLALAPLARR